MAIPCKILLVMLVVVSSADADVGPPPVNTTDWYYYGFKVMKDAERWVIDFNLDNPWNMMAVFKVGETLWSPWGWTGTWTLEASTAVSKTTIEIRTDPPVSERTTEASSKTPFVPDKWKEEGREQNAKDDNVLIYLSAVVTVGVVTLIVVTAFFSIRRKKKLRERLNARKGKALWRNAGQSPLSGPYGENTNRLPPAVIV